MRCGTKTKIGIFQLVNYDVTFNVAFDTYVLFLETLRTIEISDFYYIGSMIKQIDDVSLCKK